MQIDQDYWQESIAKFQKSKNYLQTRIELEPSYLELIDKLNGRIINFKKGRKPLVGLVSLSNQTGLYLQEIGESDSSLRSLYDFEVFSTVNIARIVDRCSVIFLIHSSHRQVNNHQRKLIEVIQRKKILFWVLVKCHKSYDFKGDLFDWLEVRKYPAIARNNFLFDRFLNCDCPIQVTIYKQILLDRYLEIQQYLIRQYENGVITEIKSFFNQIKQDNWQKIKQIKHESLQGREVGYYQQHILNKTFNKINKLQQQKILFLKQKINQSRSQYLNTFLPNSWLFQLQQIIDRSETILVKEEGRTYLYYTIKNNNSVEYLHSYILGLYQQQIIDTLNSQWHNLNHHYAEGGFNSFIQDVQNQLRTIDLLEESDFKSITSDANSELLPKIELSDIIDTSCLKINSRIVFDYNYLQSSWFKLLISTAIGTSIYVVTKLSSGTGRYIGFFILIFQTINIVTGQSIKSQKLKQHKKELQRTINNKYQSLIRLIVEQLINSLISSLDKQNQQYQQKLDRIAQLAQTKLDAIEQEIKKIKSNQNCLESDQEKLISWFK